MKIHGYYTVEDKIYTNKILALMHASKVKKQVFWHWHDSYNLIQWHQQPKYTLQEAYRMRAQQLRDSYDFISIAFSGGVDSWQVLDSFLSNGIHVDEVMTRWPLSAMEKHHKPNTQDLTMTNQVSEWWYATLPQLNYIKKNHPKTKISVVDWTNDFLKREINDDYWFDERGHHLNPGAWFSYNSISQTEKNFIEKGKKTAWVWGVDKPQLCVKGNKVYTYFIDILCSNGPKYTTGRNQELFFWSDEFPELVHSQVHVLYNSMVLNPHISKTINWDSPSKSDTINRNLYRKWIADNIYPGYGDWFQVEKENDFVHAKINTWMYRTAGDMRYLKHWQSDIDNIFESLDEEFIKKDKKGKPIGFTGFISPMYYVGDLYLDA